MRKQTRRKVYNLVNPIQYAMVGASLLSRFEKMIKKTMDITRSGNNVVRIQ